MANTHFSGLNVKMGTVDGGSAGSLTYSDIAAEDKVLGVLGINFTDTSEAITEYTSEFSAADGAIDNTGGTDTSGQILIFIWLDMDA